MAPLANSPVAKSSIESADDIVSAIAAVAPELQGLARSEEAEGKLSDRTISALADARVFDVSTPRSYGGLALDVADQLRVYAAVGRIAGSTGWISWVTTTHVRWIGMLSKAAQDEVYGMDWRGPRVSGVVTGHGPGKAKAVDGGYMLEGAWPFCSGCRHTAWSFLGAMVEKADGALEHMLMLVPAADLDIANDWDVSGLKATGSNTVRLSKPTFVPAYRVIGTMAALTGQWLGPLPEGVLYQNNFTTYTSILSGATPLGMAQAALDYYMERIGKRGITATEYAVQADAPVTHLQLMEAKQRIDAAARLLHDDAAEVDVRAAAGASQDPLFHAKIKFDVALSVRNCAEAIEVLHRGSGASTIHAANPMQRYARDVRVATIHGQFNYETCAEEYGRMLCGKAPFSLFDAK